MGSPVTVMVVVVLLDVNKVPETTAAVSLVTGGAPVIVPFNSVTTTGGNSYALYQTTASWTYTPGQVYTIGVSTSIGNASGSSVAPGGITDAPDGSQTSWMVEGNDDSVNVQQQPGGISVYKQGPDVDSPQAIPSTVYSAPASYTLSTSCMNIVTTLTGAAPGSSVIALDTLSKLYNFAPTSTPTITPSVLYTATNSPTVTITGTPTHTPTNAPTSTPTNSLSVFVTIGGSGPPANFVIPWGIKYRNGDLWVVEDYNKNLQEWTTAGVQLLGPISVYGSPSTAFNYPRQDAIDPVTGNVYVADYFNSRIVVFDSNGNFLTTFGQTEFGSGFPTGVGVNSTGTTVYTMDGTAKAVYSYTIGGTPSSPTFTNPATIITGLYIPASLSLDSADNIYESDYSGFRVLKFPPLGGSASQTFTAPGHPGFTPNDATIDPAGNVYVVDVGNHNIVEFNAAGTVIGQFGEGTLISPEGITNDGAGNIYVSEANQWRIVGFH